MANIVPVYKTGDNCSTENNSPVSMTCTCSKVMEHILLFNIVQHLDKKYILMEAQHGLFIKHSC